MDTNAPEQWLTTITVTTSGGDPSTATMNITEKFQNTVLNWDGVCPTVMKFDDRHDTYTYAYHIGTGAFTIDLDANRHFQCIDPSTGSGLDQVGQQVAHAYGVWPIGDHIRVTNRFLPGLETGLWVNGMVNPAFGVLDNQWIHHTFISTAADLNLKVNVMPSGGSSSANEVVGFTLRRSPTLVPNVPWTLGFDSIELPFNDEITLPIKIWVVGGPYSKGKMKAIDSMAVADYFSQHGRMGLRPLLVEPIEDKTGLGASNFSFGCTDKTNNLPALKAHFGFLEGVINVYIVNSIDHDPYVLGDSCEYGSGIVLLNIHTKYDTTLAHELGHNFGLRHPCERYQLTDSGQNLFCPNYNYFDITNMMWPFNDGSNQYLTEGQMFRAHFAFGSVLNGIISPYNAIPTLRPGQEVRGCDPLAVYPTLACPALCKRIWPNGPKQPSDCKEP